MREEHFFELLPGYALGILDDKELIVVSRHLAHCAVCRAELEGYRNTADRLALAARPHEPAPDLRAQVVARIERAAIQQVKSKPQSEPQSQGRLRRPFHLALLALGVALVVFLAVSNMLLMQRLDNLEARIPQNKVQVVRLAANDSAAQGYLLVFPGDQYGTLVVNDIPPLDKEHQYQLWLIQDGKRTNGGVFSVDYHGYGAMVIYADRPLDQFQSFGVTIEPAGGSPGPTGQKILGGDL